MVMEIRTIEEIKTELKNTQMARHPYLRDYNPYSVLSTLNETYSIQCQYIEERCKSAIESTSIWTATGSDLDRLVVDRGISRQEGNRATGMITFRSTLPASMTIVIPQSTILSALGSDSNRIYFETTEDGIIDVGDTSVIVDARAINPGTDGNVPEYAVNQISVYIPGINRIENVSAFAGGTEEESDDDLRERYKYAIDIVGKATKPLIEQRIFDLDTVRECKIIQRAVGEIEAIVDTEMMNTVDTTVVDCLRENIAAGIVVRGKVLASVVDGVITPNLTVTEAGNLYVRVNSTVISTNETMNIYYKPLIGSSGVVTVIIPQNTVDGDVIPVTMPVGELATQVTGFSYVGSNSFSILGGLGTYPYLYILPRKVLTNVAITIKQTDTPDPNLGTKIRDSVFAFLDAFHIDDDLEFSDLVQYIFMNYSTKDTTRDQFLGIDQIKSVYITANNSSISNFGQTINVEDDQRVDPGTVTVILV